MQELGSAPYSFTVFASIGWVALFLLVGVILRSVVPFCRKFLIPACMIGGLIGCIFTNLGLLNWAGSAAPDFLSLQMVIFHLFNLSFVCFGLSGFGSGVKGASKSILKNSTWLSFAYTGLGNLQFVIGILLIVGYNTLFDTNLLASAGYLMQQGFLTGPGAAMSAGATWEQAGHQGMISLGLAFAATGYLASIVFGVPAVNYIMKKKGIKRGNQIPEAEQRGIYAEGECPPAGIMRFMTSNVDTMSFQVALMLLGYLLAFVLITLFKAVVPVPPEIMGIFWSLFAFLFCLPAGIIMREIVIKRVFKASALFDIGCHTRLINILVDFIAVAALVGIQIAVLRQWWAILIVGSITCGICTTFYIYFLTRRNKEYAAERFLGLLGNTTGTVTSGLVLVRMIDPEYKSTVPYEMGLLAVPTLIFTLPLMPITMPLIFGQVFQGLSWTVPFYCALAMSIGFTIIAFLPFWKVNGKEKQF